MLPGRSARWFDGFARYARWFVRRNFHAVRVLREAMPPTLDGPAVFYVNHPSWWDPMIGLVAATHAYPTRRHFAPIDAAMLQKYRFFEKLGFFGVEQGTRRGAAEFLRAGLAVAAHDDAALWVTAEGRFTDARARPVALRPGLAHLARRMTRGVIVPVALEYAFWDERYPEALLAFGQPIAAGGAADVETWNALLGDRLEATLDQLATTAMTRDPARFEVILGGSVGVGGVYDLWRRGKAWVRGRRFDPRHGAETMP